MDDPLEQDAFDIAGIDHAIGDNEPEPDEGDDAGEDEDAGDDDGRVSIDDLGLPMPVLPEDLALELLTGGDLAIVGQLWVSSNNAMLATVTGRGPGAGGDLVAACIYKPVAGERPLFDFPEGTLARREVAAFAVSRASGWGIVPPTVLRDGPFGPGMVQLWIRRDDDTDAIAMVNEGDPRLRVIAAFDAAVNNTDRKAGHLLPVPGGHVYGVDHGVTFSPVPKLRTVLWQWRGEPFLDDEAEVLRAIRTGLDNGLGDELRALLDPIEVTATIRRVDRLLASGMFPQPDPRWPPVPWPPV